MISTKKLIGMTSAIFFSDSQCFEFHEIGGLLTSKNVFFAKNK